MDEQHKLLTDAEIVAALTEHWDELSRRAAARVAVRVIWERRLRRINAVLAAAVVLMSWADGVESGDVVAAPCSPGLHV